MPSYRLRRQRARLQRLQARRWVNRWHHKYVLRRQHVLPPAWDNHREMVLRYLRFVRGRV